VRARSSRLATTLAGCLVAAGLVACSEDPGPAGPAPSVSASASSPSSPGPQRPLRVTVYGGSEAVDGYRDAAASFREESGVGVRVQAHRDAATAAERVQQDLSSAGDAPDVFLLDHAYLPDLLGTERLQHVDEALEERGLQFGDGYQRVALTAFSAEDLLQCMPVEMSPLVLMVNREHVRTRDLEIRGVPRPEEGQWEFEDFDAAARVIAREHAGEPGFRAVHLPLDMELLTAMIRSAGGEIVDDVDGPTELTLDTEEAREALLAYVRLARLRAVALSAEEAAEESPVERFGRGELAMMVGSRTDVPALRESGVRFDVMPLPSLGSYRTVAEFAGLCVDSESERLEEALDLVAFIAGAEGSTTLARTGAVVPANLDVVFSPAFAQRGQPPRSVQVFGNALERSGLMPFSVAWRDVAGRIERLVGRLVEEPRNEQVLQRRLSRLEEWSRTAFGAEEPPAD
jgi:multiple sugar transport system substrate-binding protein